MEPPGRRKQSAEYRSGRHPEVARGLDAAVGRGHSLLARGDGDQRELRGRDDCEAAPDHGREDEQRDGGVGKQQEARRCGLGERHADQEPAVLDTVDEPPGDAREQHDRPEHAEEEERDRERRAGLRAHLQGERDRERQVAEGGESCCSDEQVDVTAAEGGHGPTVAGVRSATALPA